MRLREYQANGIGGQNRLVIYSGVTLELLWSRDDDPSSQDADPSTRGGDSRNAELTQSAVEPISP